MKTISKIIIAVIITVLSLIVYSQDIIITEYQKQLNDNNRKELLQNIQLNNVKCLNE